jgi:hypothetical protein
MKKALKLLLVYAGLVLIAAPLFADAGGYTQYTKMRLLNTEGSASAPTFIVGSESVTNTGFYSSATNDIKFTANGTSVLEIDPLVVTWNLEQVIKNSTNDSIYRVGIVPYTSYVTAGVTLNVVTVNITNSTWNVLTVEVTAIDGMNTSGNRVTSTTDWYGWSGAIPVQIGSETAVTRSVVYTAGLPAITKSTSTGNLVIGVKSNSASKVGVLLYRILASGLFKIIK